MNQRSTFRWDMDYDRPLLALGRDKVGGEVRFEAFGADDDQANTQLAIYADDKLVRTKRPEPLLITYLRGLIEAEEYVLSIDGEEPQVIELSESEVERMKVVADEVQEGLENAPLGEIL
jgi:hypothetical protein